MTELITSHPSDPVAEPNTCRPIAQNRILIVDDDAAIAELNFRILTRFEYTVDIAYDGADAWSQLQRNTYDLLLTDQRMPRMTGLELIARVRSAGLALPIILASGMIEIDKLNQCYGLQIEAFLNKPYTVEQLIQAVGDALDSPRRRSVAH